MQDYENSRTDDNPREPNNISGTALPTQPGPGSGKNAWRMFAVELGNANVALRQIVIEQNVTIARQLVEITQLRRQVAVRKPRGGKLPVDDHRVKRIEVALLSGAPTREIGQRYKVSAMTVSRIRKRMHSRKIELE